MCFLYKNKRVEQGSYDSGKSGKTWKKTFYSGKTWKTQGKIWILPDLRENLGKKFFVWPQNKILGHTFLESIERSSIDTLTAGESMSSLPAHSGSYHIHI